MAIVPIRVEGEVPGGDGIAEVFEEAAVAWAEGVDGGEIILVRQSDRVSPEDSPRVIAQATGASMIVTGTLTMDGDQVVVTAQVLDPTDGSVIHSLPPERSSPSDPDLAARQMADRIAGVLAVHVDPGLTMPELHSVPTIQAYRIERHADSMFARNEQNQSIPFFYEAYEADTMFLLPLFTAAAAHRNNGRGAVGDSLLDYIEARRHLLTEIEQYNLTWFRGSPEEAYQAARSARELDPLGWTYGVGLRANHAGYFPEAVEALSHRAELAEMGNYSAQTWPAWRSQYMVALHAVGDFATELAEARAANEAYPENPWWIWNEMRALAGMGDVDQVLALVDSAEVLLETHENASHFENLEDIAVELKVHGHPDEGMALLDKVIAHYREIGNQAQLADALGFAGRTREAFEALEPLMSQETSPDLVGWYGAAAAMVGEDEVAEETLNRLEARTDAASGNNLRYQAAIHGALGRCDQAIQLYRDANNAGFTYIQAWGGEWWHRDC
jgi:tetratricopeptide (TPR) repeat protein